MTARSTPTRSSVPQAVDAATNFMRAFWDGDLASAEANLTPDATWVFQPSMPYVAEAGPIWPERDAMHRITADLFGAIDPDVPFEVIITNALGDATRAVLEYEAEGRVLGGEPYANRYAACFTVRDGKVAEVRPYNDTKHMYERLLGGRRG